MGVGIGQSRSLRRGAEAQMLQRRFASGQPQANFAQRVQMRYLAKQHGHKLFPAGESLGVPPHGRRPVRGGPGAELGLMLLDDLCELSAWKKLQKLRVHTRILVSWLILSSLSLLLRKNPLQSNGDQPLCASVRREELLAILDSNGNYLALLDRFC